MILLSDYHNIKFLFFIKIRKELIIKSGIKIKEKILKI